MNEEHSSRLRPRPEERFAARRMANHLRTSAYAQSAAEWRARAAGHARPAVRRSTTAWVAHMQDDLREVAEQTYRVEGDLRSFYAHKKGGPRV